MASPLKNEIFTFVRAQLSGSAATVADYALLFGLTEFFHVWYVAATALGAVAGGITNFMVNRYWAFRAIHSHEAAWHKQAVRYFMISIGSMILNTAGVYYVTEFAKIHYAISVAIVGLTVAFCFNFPMQRHFVFR